MSDVLVECVPNISEGRDRDKIDAVVAAAAAVPGARVLDVDPGRETNRTVITIVGDPDAIAEAAFAVIEKAAEVIDMRTHSGAHARHGATDVCPFVPVANATMADCVEIAKKVGARVGAELGIPVYLYDQAAQVPERRSLAKVRAGEYEALPDKLGKPEWKPDYGPATFHAKAGVVTIGAREFLVAYNVNLNSTTKAHADDIAWSLRENGRAARENFANGYYSSGTLKKYRPSKNHFPSAYDDTVCASLDELAEHYRTLGRDLHAELELFGRDVDALEGVNVMAKGRFDSVRGVGWVIPEYNRAQMSFNLTNIRTAPVHVVYDACVDMANERGLAVTGSEIVGMIPYEALAEAGQHYLARQGASRGVPVRDVLETAAQSMGLRDVAEFELDDAVLALPRTDGALASMRVNDLCDEVSRPSPAPGGGSIAALAGALGAALTSMVANLTFGKKGYEEHRGAMEQSAMRCQELKDDLLRAIDADTDAFNAVLVAMRLPKDTDAQKAERAAAIQEGYKHATNVPFRTASLCLEAMRLCRDVAANGLTASITDVGVAAMMARAGVLGGVDNVRINLGAIDDETWKEQRTGMLDVMVAEAESIEKDVRDVVAAKL